VLKQMRLAHGVGFSREERIATLEVIRQNVVQAMQAVRSRAFVPLVI
jgi:uncharacterized protein with NRDE domain